MRLRIRLPEGWSPKALRLRIASGWTPQLTLGLLIATGVLFVSTVGFVVYYYFHFAHLIDQRLSGQVFQKASEVYSGAGQISAEEALAPQALTAYLDRAGYTRSQVAGARGWYRIAGSKVEIHPSADSYFRGQNALRVDFAGGKIAAIRPLPDGEPLSSAEVEPVLLTSLFGGSREKRRVVRFGDLAKTQVSAVLAAEDKRFFEHPGFDAIRIFGAAWADLRHGAKAQGASTITMQVARTFFFSTQRVWRRKLAETLMSLELEHRFNKQQIFELYANEVYMGNRGSFAIRGFGEAAHAYFGKDLRELSLGEQAFLAGIIRAPNHYSTAERYPARAAEARDRVLDAMVENRYISAQAAQASKREKLRLMSGTSGGSEAPYFVDLVKDNLLDRFSESDLVGQSYRIYTTLDPSLQGAAVEAVEAGAKALDTQLARRYAQWRKKGEAAPPKPQIALVAVDPRTGEIRALVGGRDYSESQLNHVLARRQPGSSFKPFVYAAAFSNAAEGRTPVVTPMTTVVDEPTTFEFDGQDYTPNNYGQQFYGTVTLRTALMRSLNVATVKVAEMVGYGRVAEVAKRMGLDPHIQATPAMALGAYEMTPLEVAAGYTALADGGVRAEPMFLRSVVGADGKVLEKYEPETRSVLDPRVAYLVTSLLEDALNHGTGAGVRARGFSAPAAGKTGTSHDGWFAGYTSNLVCVVWVGFDDNRELGLSGAASAAPIWADFMKRAVQLRSYRGVHNFSEPGGLMRVTVDPESRQLATPNCPTTQEEVFIDGTQPTEYCQLHRPSVANVPVARWFSRWLGGQNGAVAEAPVSDRPPANGDGKWHRFGEASRPWHRFGEGSRPVDQSAHNDPKKQGVWHKFSGIFGGKNKGLEKPRADPAPGNSP